MLWFSWYRIHLAGPCPPCFVAQVKGLLEDLAAKHSGDMQTHLAFHRSRCRGPKDD